MYITLMTTADDPRKVNKTTYTIAADISCKPAAPFSLLSPRILIDYSAAYLACNYVYIPELSRYYFAELSLQTGKELLVSCKIDVLNSFNLSGVKLMCVRSQSAGVNYVPDAKLPVDPNRTYVQGLLFPKQPIVYKTLPENPLTSPRYLVIINGGDPNGN